MIKVLYFARLRESLGLAEESVEVANGMTVKDLMVKLAERGETWNLEFDGCRPLRAAVNQTLVSNQTAIHNGDEVAFFPPVTGG